MTDCSECEVKNEESKSNILCQELHFLKGMNRRVWRVSGVISVRLSYLALFLKCNSSMLNDFEKKPTERD